MKKIIILLLSCLSLCAGPYVQTPATTNSNPADVAAWLSAYIEASSANWSTFPATSDVEIASYRINGVDELHFSGGTGNGSISADLFTSADTTSFLNIAQGDSAFGIYNGEPAGVGADINLVSANGSIVLFSTSNPFQFDGATGFFGVGTLTPQQAVHVQKDGSVTSTGTLDLLLEDTDAGIGGANQARYRMTTYGDLVQGAMLFKTTVGGPYSGFAGLWNTENADIAFGANNAEVARATASGDFVITGGYWSQGSQGVTGTMADGSTVTGGLITHIGP